MPDLQLGFHTTFALKKEDLQKILRVASEPQGLKDTLDNLIQRTGLGNKKVGPMKSWALRSGFIKDSLLSSEGKIVLTKDPYLESPITDWFMHFFLSLGDKGTVSPPEDPAEWGGWSWFIYSFLPQHTTFTTENLIYESSSVFEESTKNLTKNFRYVLRAYTEPQALCSCQFLQELNSDKYQAGQANLPNTHLIGYFLSKIWERDYGDVTSIVTDDLLNHPMGLAPILGLEPSALQEKLDQLEALALIEQRRTVPPFQIVKRWNDPLSLLEKAYAENY